MEDYESIAPEPLQTPESHIASGSFLEKIGKDDILLLGLLLLFLTDECEDKSILLILVFLFFSGM